MLCCVVECDASVRRAIVGGGEKHHDKSLRQNETEISEQQHQESSLSVPG